MEQPNPLNLIATCDYRPFDKRHCYYSYFLMDYPRKELIDNVFHKENLLLIVSRQQGTVGFKHVFVSEDIIESCLISNKSREGNYFFCLYLFGHKESENLKKEFRNYIDTFYNHHFSPEQILGYIYAILHSPAYRTKYAEFLKIDFPRIPFTENKELFAQISDLGWQLIEAHLLKPAALDEMPDAVHCTDNGDYEVEKIVFNNEKLFINKQQYFYPVSGEVYEFYIGGYQVLDKYLKDRKGRKLTLTETAHVSNIVKVLSYTIEQMKKIEALTQQWI